MSRVVALFVNPQKPQAREVQARARVLLESAGIQTLSADTGCENEVDQRLLAVVELAFVFGGDGTLLGSARRLAALQVPLLGINVGHLGFLAEAEPGNIEEAVRRIVQREYDLEHRVMLEACVIRLGNDMGTFLGLNDAGIAKGSFSRMVTVDAYIDNVFLDTYSGDGVIISTPTGSTAYSLSCGGPIVMPELQVMLLTPICPHSLVSRPVVFDAAARVRLTVQATHTDLGLTLDGQTGVRLQPNDEVRVQKSQLSTTLVKWRDREFFSVLRGKLHAAGPAASRSDDQSANSR